VETVDGVIAYDRAVSDTHRIGTLGTTRDNMQTASLDIGGLDVMTSGYIIIGYDPRREAIARPWFVFTRRRDGTEYGLEYCETLDSVFLAVRDKVRRGESFPGRKAGPGPHPLEAEPVAAEAGIVRAEPDGDDLDMVRHG
jgi:hypothetical protein